jgi:hypothetical protein
VTRSSTHGSSFQPTGHSAFVIFTDGSPSLRNTEPRVVPIEAMCQMEVPRVQSLQFLLCRLCSQMEEPPQSLQMHLCRSCSQMDSFSVSVLPLLRLALNGLASLGGARHHQIHKRHRCQPRGHALVAHGHPQAHGLADARRDVRGAMPSLGGRWSAGGAAELSVTPQRAATDDC